MRPTTGPARHVPLSLYGEVLKLPVTNDPGLRVISASRFSGEAGPQKFDASCLLTFELLPGDYGSVGTG